MTFSAMIKLWLCRLNAYHLWALVAKKHKEGLNKTLSIDGVVQPAFYQELTPFKLYEKESGPYPGKAPTSLVLILNIYYSTTHQ